MMVEQTKFPIVFEKCPSCGCEETVTRLAWDEEAEKGKVDKTAFASAEKILVPLVDPKKPPVLSASGLLIHYDICAGCGMHYCTKAEVATGLVKMPPLGGTAPPGMGPPFAHG